MSCVTSWPHLSHTNTCAIYPLKGFVTKSNYYNISSLYLHSSSCSSVKDLTGLIDRLRSCVFSFNVESMMSISNFKNS